MEKNFDRAKLKQILQWVILGAVCLFAFAYALYHAQTIGKFAETYTPDEGNYIKMARRLLSEGVYSYWGNGSDAYVSPGFPLFLTGLMAIFGTGVEAIFSIKVVQCVLTGLTVLLTFVLGYQLTRRYSVGIVAATLLALNGSFAFYSRYLLTETLYYFTMMLFFVAFVFALEKGKPWLHALAGALLCSSVMVRPLIIIVLPFLYLPMIVSKWKQWKAILVPIGLFLGGFVLVGLPWWIRNMVTMQDFIFLATQTNPIYAGLAPDVVALGIKDPGSMLGNIKILFDLLITNPLGTLYWMTVKKFDIIFMQPAEGRYALAFTTLVKDVTLYLGLLGALRGLFSKKLRWPVVVFMVYFLSTFLFVPTDRYALQYLPFLAIFTGYLTTLCFHRGQETKEGPLAGF